jgi:hypothetical protein
MRVVYEPPVPEWQRYSPPSESAERYRQGTVVEWSGALWCAYFDEQDHRMEWQRVKPGEDFPAIPDEPHLTPEWAALVGATAMLAEAAARWQNALDAYKAVRPESCNSGESRMEP